jgi:hypothetical protein
VTDPTLVSTDALEGVTVGISVSDSADLSRLGLTAKHCDIAVAELARAILIAGGSIVYGGRIVDGGFTGILLDEVRQHREARDALTICLAETEHRRLSDDELQQVQRELTASASIVCLDLSGEEVDWRSRPAPADVEAAKALTGLRRHITERCDARVVVGGQLAGYQGRMPGVIEEATFSVAAGQPLYTAGGFGGAAAAVAQALGHNEATFAPPGYPHAADENQDSLATLAKTAASTGLAEDGLTPEERRQLAMTHRPSDVAALTVLGLARAQAASG